MGFINFELFFSQDLEFRVIVIDPCICLLELSAERGGILMHTLVWKNFGFFCGLMDYLSPFSVSVT